MNWFYNLKTAFKLLLVFSVVGMMILFAGLTAVKQLGEMNGRLSDLYQNHFLGIRPLIETKAILNHSRNELRRLYGGNESERALIFQSVQTDTAAANERIEEFKKAKLAAEAQELLPVLETALDRYNQAVDEIAQMAANHQIDPLLRLLNDTGGIYAKGRDDTLAALDRLADINVDTARRAGQEGKEAFVSGRQLVYWIFGAAVAITIIAGILISIILSRPLQKISRIVQLTAEGDLRTLSGVRTKDEIGMLASGVDTMILNLRKVVNHTQLNAESLAAAARQISATGEEMAGSHQPESAGVIHALFKELTGVIDSLAQNTKHAAGLSEQSVRIADRGGEAVHALMSSINDVLAHMAKLEKDLPALGGIVEAIEDIADRTDLLALSAAIEAARAGEQGKGFAVVAGEVRKLAERSGSAVKEIGVLVKGVQEHTRLVATAVQESVAYSRKTADSLGDIQRIVGETGSKVTAIADESVEQSLQAASVSQVVESITSGTGDTAEASEFMAATARNLTQKAAELQASVSLFKIDRQGG
ncbi:methyl-accepting chemotaxis protein, partial [Paenibacillus forsythiae]|uniref:methyl-accepting chemotaxis protein n=1 Tax=Paenibacillus forsythiae TaxID=365616 RepID=UPI00046F9844